MVREEEELEGLGALCALYKIWKQQTMCFFCCLGALSMQVTVGQSSHGSLWSPAQFGAWILEYW